MLLGDVPTVFDAWLVGIFAFFLIRANTKNTRDIRVSVLSEHSSDFPLVFEFTGCCATSSRSAPAPPS
jgi:hypothetical protein